MKISFKEFLTFDRDTQRALGNMNMEELNKSVKKKKMDELEVLLKKHDFWYQGISGDYREWKKQNENAQEIMKLRVLIGKDGDALFWQYGKKQNYTEAKLKENQHNHKTQEKINEDGSFINCYSYNLC